MTTENESSIVIYENAENAVEVRLDSGHETLWLTQAQMGILFDVKPQNLTMHLKNIYAEGELAEAATCKDFLQVQSEGGRNVERKRKNYGLAEPSAVIAKNATAAEGRKTLGGASWIVTQLSGISG